MPALTSETYSRQSALDLAALLRSGEVTPGELLDCARTRAAEVAMLNPIAHLFADELIAFTPNSLFGGVPYLVKDIGIQIAGTPMTMGSLLQSDLLCDADDILATRLRAAGLAIFGRTTMAEMGLGVTSNTPAFGPTRNPWNPAFNAGGSSGGAAAAVAAGIVPFAHATDGFGSIRIPAAHCGVFGMKPSRARVPIGPLVGEALAGMSAVHCISRHVRDSAALLDAVHGPAVGDPYAAAPMGSCMAAIAKGPGWLRIAYSSDAPGGVPVAPEIREAVEATARRLDALGHIVQPMTMTYDHRALRDALDTISAQTAAVGIGRAKARRGIDSAAGLAEPIALAWAEAGERLTGIAYWNAVQTLHRVGRGVGAFFTSVDVYLSPTTAQLPLPADNAGPRTIEAALDETFTHAPFGGVYNAAGCPAMTVPAGFTDTGLPIGVQFGAAQGGEPMLYALAAQIEAAHPWPFPMTHAHVEP